MSKVTEQCSAATGRPAFICDYSPPRSGRPDDAPAPPPADFISVAYNPGRAVRVNAAAMAAVLRQRCNVDAIFTLATRDMNRLALQSLLLGAQALELQNVIAVAGDPFPATDAGAATVDDYRPTELIGAIANLNAGVDYRGRNLRAPTDFCIGATVDLGRGIAGAARLAARKVSAGAQFLITQPVYDAAAVGRFNDAYYDAYHNADRDAAGPPPNVPIFWGIGLLEPDGISFASVPPPMLNDLSKGRSGVDIAREIWAALQDAGVNDCYLVPPIRRSGARNYAAARQFLAHSGR